MKRLSERVAGEAHSVSSVLVRSFFTLERCFRFLVISSCFWVGNGSTMAVILILSPFSSCLIFLFGRNNNIGEGKKGGKSKGGEDFVSEKHKLRLLAAERRARRRERLLGVAPTVARQARGPVGESPYLSPLLVRKARKNSLQSVSGVGVTFVQAIQ